MDIKCINWIESRGDNRFLFLKARMRCGDTIYIRFPFRYYHVIDDDGLRDLTPPPLAITSLGEFEIADIDEHIYTSYDVEIHRRDKTQLWLIEDSYRREIKTPYMSDFMNITWFYIINKIDPNGCYTVNNESLIQINAQCFHCEHPASFIIDTIPMFEIVHTCLFLDIECQFDKKFPSVFSNPISHISFCYHNKHGEETRFSLININILPDTTSIVGDNVLPDAYSFVPSQGVFFCTEINMLLIAKRLIERSFDFIVSFNGNNFDLRYIANRLELLTNTNILFRLPDNSEIVKLCIYERHLASHRGVGGMSQTSFHINNNNGTIFFDLYTFMQKTERLDSYKLDNISKTIFFCTGHVTAVEGTEYIITSNDSIDRVSMFSTVLGTGNYVTLNDVHILKITHKHIMKDSFSITIRSDSLSLKVEDVCTLSFGKDDVDLRMMYKYYTVDVAREMEQYCMHDACLCKYIWDYYRIPSKIDAAASTYVLPQRLSLEYKASTLIKGPLLRLLLKEHILFVRNGTRDRYLYSGGRVLPPKKKIFDTNVMIFDYNSLYPNVCIFANLSPETLVCVIRNDTRLDELLNSQELLKRFPPPRYIHITCESRTYAHYNEIAIYDRNREGIIPMLLRTFMQQRKYYKDLLKSANGIERVIYDSMQYVYKIVANSVYGLMGFFNSSLYSYTSAKCCTTIGRSMITYLETILNGATLTDGILTLAMSPRCPFFETADKNRAVPAPLFTDQLKFNSVYGDTDSIFLEVNSRKIDETIAVARFLETVINEYILFSNFKIEFEAVYKDLILQSKKKYTTLKFPADYKPGDVPSRINKGTSETRRDVSKYHKEMIFRYKTSIITMLGAGTSAIDVCQNTLRNLECDFISEFHNRPRPLEMFLLSRTHHKNYKLPDHPNVELVNKYNKDNLDTIELGERYYYVYICSANLPWQMNITNIRSYEYIVDTTFSLPNTMRIFYEVYFKRLASEVINLLDNRPLVTGFFERTFGTRPIFSTF